MKRKIKIILTLLLIACVSFTVVGCHTTAGKGGNYELSATQCTLKCYEEFQLQVFDGEQQKDAEWVSLNNQVASVKDGLVIAKTVGSSVIKAVVGGKSLSCLVTVVSNDKVPAIFTDDDSFALVKDGSLKVTPKIMFDGKLYEDGEFSFEIADQEICEIQNGTIVGKEYGQTVLRIKGEWRGAEGLLLVKEVPLSVKKDASILTSRSEVVLYTENEVEGTQDCPVQEQLSATLRVENVVDNSKTITWETDNDQLISLSSNGLITVNTNGETGVAYVWAKVQTSDIDVVSDAIKITVAKPVIDKTQQISLIHDMAEVKQAIDTVKVFGSATEVVSVTDVLNPSTEMFKNGMVEYTSNTATQREWIISAKTYSVKVAVKCVTKVLRTPEDINNMDNLAKPINYNDQSSNSFSGWFVLGNDIDYENKTYVSEVTLSGGLGGSWNNAIFDGQGYCIKNITFSGNGFFGIRAYNCTYKNVVLTGVRLTTFVSSIVSRQLYGTCLIENVYAQVTSTVANNFSSSLAIELENTSLSKIRNVVVDVVSATNADRFSGIINTNLKNPRLEVFNAVYTIGAKVNVGSRVDNQGAYNEDSSKNVNLAQIAPNHVGYVGGAYQTDAEFLEDQTTIFTGDFANVFTVANEGGQQVLKFMGRTVKTFDTATV